MKDLLEHINRCRMEALKKHIEANLIVIDKDVAITNSIYYPTEYGVNYIPPMIMGMRVDYEKNLRDEYGFNFVISESHLEPKPTIRDFSTDELLEELRRRTKYDED